MGSDAGSAPESWPAEGQEKSSRCCPSGRFPKRGRCPLLAAGRGSLMAPLGQPEDSEGARGLTEFTAEYGRHSSPSWPEASTNHLPRERRQMLLLRYKARTQRGADGKASRSERLLATLGWAPTAGENMPFGATFKVLAQHTRGCGSQGSYVRLCGSQLPLTASFPYSLDPAPFHSSRLELTHRSGHKACVSTSQSAGNPSCQPRGSSALAAAGN